MEEAELICDRIIILDKGKIIAEGTSSDLKKLINVEEKITIAFENIPKGLIEKLKKLKNVVDIDINGLEVIINYHSGIKNLENLIDCLKENKVKYKSIFQERPTLNDVFLSLTGKDLRD